MCTKSLQSCLTLCNPMDCSPPGSSVHGDSSGKNIVVGCHALLQEDLPNPGMKPVSLMSPALAGGFFTGSTTWEDLFYGKHLQILFWKMAHGKYRLFVLCCSSSLIWNTFNLREKLQL